MDRMNDKKTRKYTVGFWIEGGFEMELEARDYSEAVERARREFSIQEALEELEVVDLLVTEKRPVQVSGSGS